MYSSSVDVTLCEEMPECTMLGGRFRAVDILPEDPGPATPEHCNAVRKFRGYLGQANGGGTPGKPKCPDWQKHPLSTSILAGHQKTSQPARGTSRRGRAERRRVPAVVRSLPPPARAAPRAPPPPAGRRRARGPLRPRTGRRGPATRARAGRGRGDRRRAARPGRGPSRPVAARRGRSRRPRGGRAPPPPPIRRIVVATRSQPGARQNGPGAG